MRLLLAPMEGLLDFVLRDVLTRVGGADRCVSEFIRVTGTLLPDKVFLRTMPELNNGSRTLAGCPCGPSCWDRTRTAWRPTRPIWRAWGRRAST